MPAILALLLEALATLAGLLVRVAAIQATVDAIHKLVGGGTANTLEHSPYQIETTVTNAELAIIHPTSGLVNAYAQARTDTATILAAIAAITPSPPAPPPSGDDIATAVWRALDPNSPGAAGAYGDEQYEPYARAIAMNEGGAVRLSYNMHFFGFGYFGSVHAPSELADSPLPDWSAILATDTRLTWLNRTAANFTWSEDPDSHIITGFKTNGTGTITFAFDLSEQEFAEMAGSAPTGTPIWPGQAGVTDGTPVVLTSSDIVAGPMDGVKLTVDSVEPGGGQYGVSTFTSYYRAGYLIFLSAEGHADDLQYLGPDDNVYVPKRMLQAGSVVVILNKASQVTVTPWVLA